MAKPFDWLNSITQDSKPVSSSRLRRPQEDTYYILQSTGLMHGIDPSESIRLFQSFIKGLYNVYGVGLTTTGTVTDEHFCNDIVNFYQIISPKALPTNWFKNLSLSARAKKTLHNRIKIATDKKEILVNQVLFNQSKLLIETLLFGEYITTNKDATISNYLLDQYANMFLTCTMVISASAQANSKIEKEERTFFSSFIKRSMLTSSQKQSALDTLDHPQELHRIQLKEHTPWTFRKFLLELAWFTIWSDGRLENSENDFMSPLAAQLGLTYEDLNLSAITVESQLTLKGQFVEAKNSLIVRISNIVDAHEDTIITDIRKKTVLMNLLKKGNTLELNQSDKESVRLSLMSLLQRLPIFRYIMLNDNLLSYNDVIGLFSKKIMRKLLV